ncbi:GAF domain-containing protein [uncultured Roseobacter sp.]|uniref:GAF domain-containing protein n=1 Tax=uncultured Roseobacter sp. TaxID=114847 RepID=UPI0026031B53|nr:GAF domain-containing protein [uncultured Roseobacter sp.]
MEDRFDILRRIRLEFGSEITSVTRIDISEGKFSHIVSTVFSDCLEAFETPRLSTTCCARVIETGRPFMIADMSRTNGDVCCPMMTAEGIAAYMGVPLFTGGYAAGALEVFARKPREWRDDEVDTLERYARIFETLLDDQRVGKKVSLLRQVR